MLDHASKTRTQRSQRRRRMNVRRMLALVTVGTIYQASGCQINDVNALAGGLAASVAASFVTDYVNEVFGVSGGGFF
ncbi:MAG: hypothetical protein IID37_00045 [Planctomycetes bacterium]|nr:hypothetical protein [Planctomycetota bacterium]